MAFSVIYGTNAERSATNFDQGTVFFENDTGNEYLKTGSLITDWLETGTNGASNVSDKSLSLLQGIQDGSGNIKTTASDILPVVYRNIQASADYTGVLAAEITEVDLTLANHPGKTVTASALVISYGSGALLSRGVYVTINLASSSAAATEMDQGAPDNSAAVTDHAEVFFCPPGITLIPYNQVINLVHLLADDADGSEANTVQVSPL